MLQQTLLDSMLLLAQDTAAAPPAPGPKEMSLLDYIKAGSVVGYAIILMSFVAVALVIRFLVDIRRDKVMPPAVGNEMLSAVRAGNIEAVRQMCDAPGANSFLTRVVGSALRRCTQSPFGMLEIRSALEESGQREVDRLYRYTEGIGLIAAIGPMMGLLGTVFGMIGAFGSIGGVEGAARSQQLASYMSIALVTTAEGLIVAIPCTVLYSVFRRRIERYVDDAGEIIEQLATFIERAAEQPATGRAPAPTPIRPAQAAAPATPERGARAS